MYDDALFRAQFPEFADTTKYPAALLSAYWSMATSFITASGSPCGALGASGLPLALNYMTAHLYVLAQLQAAAAGGPGSSQGGFETSASIGEVSVATMAPPAATMWQWWLAQTAYGQALAALLSVLAVGGTSVGGLPERYGFRKVGGVFF